MTSLRKRLNPGRGASIVAIVVLACAALGLTRLGTAAPARAIGATGSGMPATASNGLFGGAEGWASAAQTIEYGIAEPATDLPGTFDAADLAAWSEIRADVAGSGACWLRSDLNEWLTRAIDKLDWLGSSAACGTSRSAPVKVMAILDQETVWSAARLCPNTEFSATYLSRHNDFTLDDWRALVACVATRYRGRISAYEIWNEPLLPYSMLGYEDGTAAHYADLLRVAYGEIKAADPSAIVIALGGSDLYAGGDQGRLDQMREFTAQLLALGARRYADAISLHAYPWGRDDAAVWSSYSAELQFQAHAWRLPVWISETGTRTTDAGTQSSYAEKAYALFVRAGAGHVFWFADTDQPDGSFGLRGRAVQSTLRAFALAHP